MNKINNKNLILFGIIGLALLFTVIPFSDIEAAGLNCGNKICGYKRDIQTQKYYNQNLPSYCSTVNTCGSEIDQTVRNTYPTVTQVNSNQGVINPKPIIDSISPNTVDSGKGEMWVTVYGVNFVKNSVVKFNSSDRATAYISPNKLQAKLTDTDINGSGEYLITVFNPLPGGGYSNAEFFTILGGPTEAKTGEELDSSLAAGALFGADGFFPNSFMGWLLLAILILLGVILWRKFYYTDEKKHSPLKHA